MQVSDARFYAMVKSCLMRSLRQICLSLDFVRMCGLEPKFHGRSTHEASHYCVICEFEVSRGPVPQWVLRCGTWVRDICYPIDLSHT